MKKTNTEIGNLLFVLEAIPLLIYLFILIANIMSLAGEGSGNETFLLEFVMKTFLIVTTTYPVTYIACLIHFKMEAKIWKAIVPMVHIMLGILFFYLWMGFESK